MFWIGWAIVTGTSVFALWKFVKGPESLQEQDEASARNAKDAMRTSGRLRVRQRGEWEKRLMAMWRLGESRRAKANINGECGQ